MFDDYVYRMRSESVIYRAQTAHAPTACKQRVAWGPVLILGAGRLYVHVAVIS